MAKRRKRRSISSISSIRTEKITIYVPGIEAYSGASRGHNTWPTKDELNSARGVLPNAHVPGSTIRKIDRSRKRN